MTTFREREIARVGLSEYAARYGPDFDPEPVTVLTKYPMARHYQLTPEILNPNSPKECITETSIIGLDYPCPCGDYIWRRVIGTEPLR